MRIRSVRNKKGSVQKYKYEDRNGNPVMSPPNDVAPDFWVYELNPQIENLSPLARFLFENLRGYYVGDNLSRLLVPRTTLFNGKTEAETMRQNRHPNAEALIRVYNLENVPTKIEDWRYRYIGHDEADEEYLNSVAGDIVRAGTVRVKIGDHVFEVANASH